MPIYEFACPKCRVIFNFLSRRLETERAPACPKCGGEEMEKQVSIFAAPRRAKESSSEVEGGPGDGSPMPDLDDPRMHRAMAELERDMAHMDENNPRHMARMMRKMKELMPADATPRELEIAIKRLEAGEDPEKIEEDMGDLLGDLPGGPEHGGGAGGYSRDSGLYDY